MADKILSEEHLQRLVEQWFKSIGLPHKPQQHINGGSRVDLTLQLHQETDESWCVVELKPHLSTQTTSVKDLANYFEQCIKYHFLTGLPVFLGPFFIPTMGISSYVSGGSEPRHATAAFSAFAGRLNIGLMFINATPGFEHNPDYWYGIRMIMRQQSVVDWHKDRGFLNNSWPQSHIDLVDYSGAASKSVRG